MFDRLALAGALFALMALSTPVVAQSATYPITVEHALGQTVIAAEPKRVVSLNQRDTDTLLALGIQPVAANSTLGFPSGVGPWAEPRLGETKPVVWHWDDLNYEAIAATEPDLIIYVSSGGDEDEYRRLSQIAPTVPMPKGAKPWDATLAEATLLTAEAVGRRTEAEQLLAELDAHIASIAAAHPEFAGKTVNYLNSYDTDLYGFDQSLSAHQILYRLGFAPSPSSLDLPGDESWAEISPELVGDFDADILVFFTYGRSLDELLAAIPTLGHLGAVKSGHAFALSDEAFNVNSILSLPYALDNLAPTIAAALAQ